MESLGSGRQLKSIITLAMHRCASAENWFIENWFLEAKHKFAITSWNLSCAKVGQGIVAIQGSVEESHRQQESGTVIDELVVLTASCTKDDVFWVSIVLHSPLIESYNSTFMDRLIFLVTPNQYLDNAGRQ